MKLFFILNPAAGGYKTSCPEVVTGFFKTAGYETVIELTKSKGDAGKLSKKAIQSGFKIVVAAGGDGTVNEIANTLIRTDTALGILPMGSGNGLARHHKIPMDFIKALEVVKRNNQTPHDAIQINDQISFNVSGIGFDAHVAHLFGKDGRRGFSGYARLVINEFSKYRNFKCRITNGKSANDFESMMISIANSSQFGNNAFIAPAAETNDGKVNITLVKKMPALALPAFALRVFNKTISGSKYATLFSGSSFHLTCEKEMPLHIDGEPGGYHKDFSVTTLKSAIRLIVP